MKFNSASGAQDSSYTNYEKMFKEMVVDLRAQGNVEEVLNMVFNAFFILELNKEQFEDKLTPIFGERIWSDYQDLSAELNTYAEATERMKEPKRTIMTGKSKFLELNQRTWIRDAAGTAKGKVI